jgi:translation initiation factor 2B subunit (eIF-2B alpha/beta/delta family)
MEGKREKFNNICRDIKLVKIQGATNIAKAALKAYTLFPTSFSKRKLLSLRPTEPMLFHVLELAEKLDKKIILSHFAEAQNKINEHIFKLIRNKKIIFTHCHSTNVVKSLVYCRKKGRNFEVYNTETRPLYQGRKTAKELRKAGIKVTMFIDSAVGIALSNEQGTKKADIVLLGADAILKKGVINKVGSEMFANIAKDNKIPVYVVADSWKYADRLVKLEQRDFREVWENKKIHIRNPAFEFVDKKYIRGVVSELGILDYNQFLKKNKMS